MSPVNGGYLLMDLCIVSKLFCCHEVLSYLQYIYEEIESKDTAVWVFIVENILTNTVYMHIINN